MGNASQNWAWRFSADIPCADGTYLGKVSDYDWLYFCCVLPKSFLPCAAPLSLLPEQQLMMEPISAGNLGQLCPGPGA